MTAPNVLSPEQTTANTDHYFETVHDGNIPQPILVLLRNLQTQITALDARVVALEA
jgi:hypothetical protein